MTFYEVPKTRGYSLDQYRSINTEFLTATSITGSKKLTGSAIQGETGSFTNISGSQESLSGNLYVIDTITGSALQISTIKKGTFNLTAQSGSIPHGLTAAPAQVFLSVSGSTTGGTSATWYLGGLLWFLSGSTGFWVVQTGSGTLGVNWEAKI